MKRFISVLVSFILIISFSACGNETKRADEEIIKDIITYYGSYGTEADSKVKQLLDELNANNSKSGELWKDIMDLWNYANNELTVNTDRLPDDLPNDDSLCIVVLGFQLNNDGTMKDELIGRLNTALSCSVQYPNAFVLCTGGGTAEDNPEVTEAGLMGEWLKEHGLDEKRLIIENRSLSTAQNAEFSYDIILSDYPQIHSIALVSSSYHIARGTLLFEASLMKTASEKETPEIHVVSNCAYPVEKDSSGELLRFEAGGMLQLIGDNELAAKYYSDTHTKPEL